MYLLRLCELIVLYSRIKPRVAPLRREAELDFYPNAQSFPLVCTWTFFLFHVVLLIRQNYFDLVNLRQPVAHTCVPPL